MTRQLLYQLLFPFFFLPVFAQKNSTTNYHPPLDIPLILSANFGELRPNHFHMGVDFKTNGTTGLKLYAIEKGYVSRIKVSPYGYGKVVYINHPNGVTSVYAHCSTFVGKIDSLVTLTQQKEQNFEVEIFPKPTEIVLQKGENFALSGNTGSSTAPHLHFELRDTKTESAMNPLIFGFDLIDTKAPEIRAVKIYGLTEKGYLLKGKNKTIPVSKGKFGYYIGGNATTIPSNFCSEQGGIGFAFDVIDHYNQADNPLGLYGSYLIVNNDTIFGHHLDSVSFDHTRYINSHTDYEEYHGAKKKYHKSFRTKENPLTIYHNDNIGIIHLQPNDTAKINYVAYDTKNNKSELTFKVSVLAGVLHSSPTLSPKTLLFPDSSFSYKGATFAVDIPEGCVYEPIPKQLETEKSTSIGSSSQPIQKTIAVKLKLVAPQLSTEKYYIAANGSYLATKYTNGWLSADSKSLGSFSIKVDTIPPSIATLNFTKIDTLCTKPVLSWKVSENKTSLVDYDLFVDGHWQVLEYETKGSYLFFRKPENLVGKHFLKIILKDACGNEMIWEKEMSF